MTKSEPEAGEDAEVDVGDRSAGVAVADEQAAAAQRPERAFPGVAADAVEHDIDTRAVGQVADAGGKILIAIEDDLVGPGGAGDLGLLGGAGGSEDARPGGAQPLDEQLPDPAGGGVDEHRLPSLDLGAAVDEELGGAALQHHGRGGLVADEAGERHGHVGSDDAARGVGADRTEAAADPVADGEVDDLGSDRFDDPGGLEADAARQRHGIEARAVIGVDEVDADRGVADEDLATAGIADRDLLQREHVGAAGCGETDGVIGHDGLQLGVAREQR